jgi:hypothetical protein
VTCPVCKTKVQEKMSSEAPKRIYHCPKCLSWLSPKQGDHCIYDSYGSVKCPPIQIKERRAKKLPIWSERAKASTVLWLAKAPFVRQAPRKRAKRKWLIRSSRKTS